MKLDLSGVYPFISEKEIFDNWSAAAGNAAAALESGSCPGGEFTDWLRLPESREGAAAVKAEAARLSGLAEVLLVIGVGGSYLGARALIELLTPELERRGARVLFAGKDLSARRAREIEQFLENRNFCVNVISKSGTTTEPAIAFRLALSLLEKKYGKNAGEHIAVTTDKEHGALAGLARERGWRSLVIPDGVGGRYSVLTPVGLLPIAVAGLDIDALLDGAAEERKRVTGQGASSAAARYAMARRALCAAGRGVELLSLWEPKMRWFGEWYRQLFGESEGKEGRGILPTSLEMTADLHSMGQYVQQGPRNMFETMLSVSEGAPDIRVPIMAEDTDGLGYLGGTELREIGRKAERAVAEAHISGGVPVIELTMDDLRERDAGGLVYFFEYACALSGLMDGVNPFDQPGVEAYKWNMFRLLGKPGYNS